MGYLGKKDSRQTEEPMQGPETLNVNQKKSRRTGWLKLRRQKHLVEQ